MPSNKYLDYTGLEYLWGKIEDKIQQPDWLEEDDTSSSYVNNKPLYLEYIYEEEVLVEEEFTTEAIDLDGGTVPGYIWENVYPPTWLITSSESVTVVLSYKNEGPVTYKLKPEYVMVSTIFDFYYHLDLGHDIFMRLDPINSKVIFYDFFGSTGHSGTLSLSIKTGYPTIDYAYYNLFANQYGDFLAGIPVLLNDGFEESNQFLALSELSEESGVEGSIGWTNMTIHDPVLVTITGNDTDGYTADVSYSDLRTAHLQGRPIFLKYTTMVWYTHAGPATSSSSTLFTFGTLTGGSSYYWTISSGNVVTKHTLRHVSSVNGQTGVVTLAIPEKTSDITNDSGFITSSSLPTKTSDLTNDSGFITSSSVPTKTSDLTNDSGFVTTDTNTTYTISISNNVITLTPSSGQAQSITLPVYNGSVSSS